MNVHIPTPLRSYTQQSVVLGNGTTLNQVIRDLDQRFPGFRFRIVNEQAELREHIKIFVNQRIAQSLDEPVEPNDQVRIIMAISGGLS